MSNLHDTAHHAYMAQIQARFTAALGSDSRLFTTSVTRTGALWAAYLSGFPEGAERQHHNCNACRSFIERFGSLVTITEGGIVGSPIWNYEDAPAEYRISVARMIDTLAHAQVTGVFVSSDAILGTPEAGGWAHFAVRQPARLVHTSRVKTAGQRRAELREDFGMVQRALAKYSPETVKTALGLLQAGNTLYRSEKVLGVAQWFASLQGKSRLLVWRAVASAPSGFSHVSSSMIGTLLDDIQAGMGFEAVKSRFSAKMSPQNYQRAQAAPTAGAVERAEKLIADMGLQVSLQRRYATLDRVAMHALWIPPVGVAKAPVAASALTGVFGHLKPAAVAPAPLAIPPQTMTWEKFQRTILPHAHTLEALVPASDSRFVALVAPADPTAPKILQWDNQISWYYAAGMDAEMRRRVTSAGGQYDNVDIRASLLWDNRNDLDLHVLNPLSQRIYYGFKRDNFGGYLDVDMNVQGETTKPVENTRWARGTAPDGKYEISVWNYRHHQPVRADTPFRVEIEAGGRVMQLHGIVPARMVQELVPVARVIKKGSEYTITPLIPTASVTSAPTDEVWGLTPGQFARVNAIVPSPNLWNTPAMPQHGVHTMLLLEGCRDTAEGVGRGFFTETLLPELREVRSTLEAYTATSPIAGAAYATACGLGMNDATAWDITLRVNGGATYRIDRRD